jgi:hypothetical protein
MVNLIQETEKGIWDKCQVLGDCVESSSSTATGTIQLRTACETSHENTSTGSCYVSLSLKHILLLHISPSKGLLFCFF